MPHLLKGLELNGFKSFASKTTLDLSHGITAVVGPNGSGKSNVIDAIRWLLGEREAKNLRGGKGEDLIFAGTPKRPRMGLAQASLHFDNSNKFFPVEFPEIVVTRQVNRDGSNQYFINKSEVRLKDLIDFFAQARLGARGLVVVTQGNSDMFIQATPLGRREMIEEMLGLREYQLKKTDAEKRLKNTQINLDKVKALTEEILPHLRSLKRQTNRWEKRDLVEQELKQLENAFYGGERKEIIERLSVEEAAIKEHETGRSALEDMKLKAEDNLARVEAAQPEERREINDIKARTQALLETRSTLQKDLGRLEAQVEIAVSHPVHAAPTPEAFALAALLKNIKVKLHAALNAADPARYIREILEEIDSLTEAPKVEGSASRTEVPAAISAELEKLRHDLGTLEAQIAALKTREKELELNQEQFYVEFKRAVAAVDAAKAQLERWDAENREKLFALERLQIRRGEWERQVRQAGRLPEDFTNLPAEAMALTEDRPTSERRMFRLRGELAAIGEIDEALLKEAHETENRYEFLTREHADLEKAKEDLKVMIEDLNAKIRTEFNAALHKINEEFDKFFGLMFGGGQAKLKLQDLKKKAEKKDPELADEGEIRDEVKIEEEEEPEQGIEVSVHLPRKRITSLDMLSGGERSLVGIAALFALVSVSPPPFLVLDEVDAPLDERNARRFSEMLKEFSKETQFILVTHNRATMESADILYGVTMDSDGVSKVVSLKLENETSAPMPSPLT
jgi:chromosome segregation ATPase